MRGADTANSRQCKTRQNRNTPGHPRSYPDTGLPGRGHGRQTSGDRGRGRDTHTHTRRQGHATGHPDTDAAGEGVGEKQVEGERERHREGRGGAGREGVTRPGVEVDIRATLSRRQGCALYRDNPRAHMHTRIFAYSVCTHTMYIQSCVCPSTPCHLSLRTARTPRGGAQREGAGSCVCLCIAWPWCAVCAVCCLAASRRGTALGRCGLRNDTTGVRHLRVCV